MKKVLIIAVLLAVAGFTAYLSKRAEPAGGQVAAHIADQRPTTNDRQQTQEELGISVYPEKILQGDPARVMVYGAETPIVESLAFNGRKLGVFTDGSKVSALIGIDLRMKPGSYPLVLTLSDGRTAREDLVVGERIIAKAPLGIPDKLGGNTPEAEQELINTLIEEGRIISAVPSSLQKLWSGTFRLPVAEPAVITDTYGYSRQTGGSSISHKGTDFRAPTGTPVYAMNSGRVAFVQYLRNYGNTVIIDHGLGLQTIYMHMSETVVGEGETVKKGQVIGKSGETGYTLGAHLHLTVRIDGISIDPEKFLALFGPRQSEASE